MTTEAEYVIIAAISTVFSWIPISFAIPKRRWVLWHWAMYVQGDLSVYQEFRDFQGRKGGDGHSVGQPVAVLQWAQPVSPCSRWLSHRHCRGHEVATWALLTLARPYQRTAAEAYRECQGMKGWGSTILRSKMRDLQQDPTSTHWNKFYLCIPKTESHALLLNGYICILVPGFTSDDTRTQSKVFFNWWAPGTSQHSRRTAARTDLLSQTWCSQHWGGTVQAPHSSVTLLPARWISWWAQAWWLSMEQPVQQNMTRWSLPGTIWKKNKQ